MTAGNFEVSAQYNIEQHIEYVLGVMTNTEHHSWGIQKTLDAINFHLPETFDYSPDYFITRLAKFLEKNDVIKYATIDEVHALSERIISETGRNYRMVELIEAFRAVLRAWEVQTGNLEWT